MWVILPVKRIRDAKQRLSGLLTNDQRANLSRLLFRDTLDLLTTSNDIEGITVVTADKGVARMAREYGVDCIVTESDRGHSADAAQAISSMDSTDVKVIALLPTDVPALSHNDLRNLASAHRDGITLCPAPEDGGTNGVVFSPPLRIELQFGENSLEKFQREAKTHGVGCQISRIPGLERDVDRPEDLEWLAARPDGGRAWAYVREINAKSE